MTDCTYSTIEYAELGLWIGFLISAVKCGLSLGDRKKGDFLVSTSDIF